jgi:hypothetical protein
MIIIGVHSKAKRGKGILGTAAQKVAHQSNLPVLIVKKSVKDSYQNILAPTDFEIQSKQSVLFVKNIFPKAKISVIHASETIYIEGPYSIAGGIYLFDNFSDANRYLDKHKKRLESFRYSNIRGKISILMSHLA